MIRAFRAQLRGDERSGGIYFAKSASAARYDYLLDVRDCYPDITFADITVRRDGGSDRLRDPETRQGLHPAVLAALGEQRAAVDEWNDLHPVGSAVTVRMDSGEVRETTTRSRATLMCDHAVVWLTGIAGCYALSHVTARKEVAA